MKKYIRKTKNKYKKGGIRELILSVKEIIPNLPRIVTTKILKRMVSVLETKKVIEKEGKVGNTIMFSKEKKVKVTSPMNQTTPKEFEHLLGVHKIKRKVAYSLKNVELYGKYAIVVSKNGKIILEEMENYSTLRNITKKTSKKHYKYLVPQIRKFFRNKKSRKKRELKIEEKTAINLVPRHFGGANRSNHGNYGHWLAEDLPRLQAAKKYQKVTGREPQVIIRKDPPSWMTETLRLMGLSSSDLIEWQGGSEVIPKLLVPELKNYHSRGTAMDPAGRDWVSRTMKRNINMSKNEVFPKRVFASRQDAGLRKIANYNEVKSVLNSFGVVPVKNEELSVEDQIKLYDQVEIIVGMFGANLVNMIFSSSIKVIEIFEKGDIRPVYFITANEMGHEYSYLEGVESKYANINRPTETVVDTRELENLLERTLR